MASAQDGVSEYEQRRLENIRRNQEVLKSLALGVTPVRPASDGEAQSQRGYSRRQRQPQKRRNEGDADTESADPSMALLAEYGLRRSSRLASRPSVSMKEPSLPALPSGRRQARTGSHAQVHLDSTGVGPAVKRRAVAEPNRPKTSSTSSLSPSSSKLLHANLSVFHKQYLGKEIPKLGTQVKRAVMNVAAAPKIPTFNRMSGIQEWKNAVFLFVNVDASSYDNMFLKGGRQITWFAQPTQKPHTPVIQRLEAAKGDDKCPILLFCRLPGEPYVHLGRLSVLSIDTAARPIRFVWNLMDYDAVKSHPILAEA